MGKSETEKGKRGERKARDLLNSFGYAARRSQQYSGVVFDSTSADVIEDEQQLEDGLRSIPARIEVKFGYEDEELWRKEVQEWIAAAESETPEKERWAILWKQPYRPWTIIFKTEPEGIVVQSTEVESVLKSME